jgi:transcriptional regulator with XRE-family HTH domain
MTHKMKPCERCDGTGQEPDNEFTGAAYRKLRMEAGLSQREVAAEVGCSAQYVCDLEKGRRLWNTAMLNRFDKAFKALGV